MTGFIKKILPKGLKERVKARLWGSLPLSWETSSGCHLKIRNHSDWCMFMDIFVDGEYDRPIQDTIQTAPAGGTLRILDLGTNTGFFLLRFFDLWRKSARADLKVEIVAIDAAAEVLVQAGGALPAEAAHCVKFIRGLAGKKSGRAAFYHSGFSCAGNIFARQDGRAEELEYVDLAAVAKGRIDLLKVDIEGSEEDLILEQPELFQRVDRVVAELHKQRCDASKCKRLLMEAGFKNPIVARENEWFEVVYLSRSRSAIVSE